MQTGTIEELEDGGEGDLAGLVLRAWERVKPHLAVIGGALGLCFAAAAGWTLVESQRAATRSRSWDDCFAAIADGGGPRLDEAVRRYAGSPAAQWCQLLSAESALAEGSQLLFTDPARGRARLEQAAGVFASVLAERPGRMAAERAVLGLAKAREGCGDLEAARKGYETIASEYTGGGLEDIARDRAASLARESTRRWYDWFDARQPPAASPAVTPPPNPPVSPDVSATDRNAAAPAAGTGTAAPATAPVAAPGG